MRDPRFKKNVFQPSNWSDTEDWRWLTHDLVVDTLKSHLGNWSLERPRQPENSFIWNDISFKAMCEPATGFQCGRAIWISHPLLLQFDTCNSLFSLLTVLKFSMKTIRHVKVNHWFIRHNFTAFKYLEHFYTALILFKPTIIAFSGWNTLIDSNVASCERFGKWANKETQCVVFLCRWLKTLTAAVC